MHNVYDNVIDKKCLEFNGYNRTTWDEASSYCQNRGGKLMERSSNPVETERLYSKSKGV